VVFLSHRLLNQNTRYPGGAFRAGAVMEVSQRLAASVTGPGACRFGGAVHPRRSCQL
jgi:hypothetical protein